MCQHIILKLHIIPCPKVFAKYVSFKVDPFQCDLTIQGSFPFSHDNSIYLKDVTVLIASHNFTVSASGLQLGSRCHLLIGSLIPGRQYYAVNWPSGYI